MTDEEKIEFAQPILDFFSSDESPEDLIARASTMHPLLLNIIAGYEPWPETVEELKARLASP